MGGNRNGIGVTRVQGHHVDTCCAKRVAVAGGVRAPLALLPCRRIEEDNSTGIVGIAARTEDPNHRGVDRRRRYRGGGEMAIFGLVGREGRGDLHGLILGDGRLGRSHSRGGGRKENTCQNPDDRNDHEQLDEREPVAGSHAEVGG